MERIYSINKFLKSHFGSKVVKLSLDGGFTCPNRDGSKGYGGCIFCSSEGSGELASNIPQQMEMLADKWPNVDKYLAYFQSHTSTYAPVEELRRQYYQALAHDKVEGIVIATRPDCLDDDVLELLDEINQKHFLWVEMGLQTIHEDTAQLINRCYTLDVYDTAVEKLNKLNIRYVTHLILGLPGESREDMIESVKYICKNNIFGLKIHMLNVVKGSQMEKMFPDYNSFDNIEEYINFVCDLIEIIPENITIHRMTGDVPRHLLISPEWSYRKRTILNGITQELKRRNSYQGCKAK
ncbi:MAG: TIGR01212 family radical SAM protein [Eubacterium sp.]|nr:TIGR01212 family radical SAM protein [Eubacterium sp.]